MGNTIRINQCEVAVVRGLLHCSKEDVIVNITSADLDLQKSASGKALADAAGPELQECCRTLVPLQIAEVKVSDAYRLPCKKILHCNITTQESSAKAINECLRVVDMELMYESIVFPSLMAGSFNSPKEAAHFFIRCINDYSTTKHKNIGIGCLRKILIVVFPADISVYKEFNMAFIERRMQDPTNMWDLPGNSITGMLKNYSIRMAVDQELKLAVSFMERLEEDSKNHPLVTLDRYSDEFWNVWTYFEKSGCTSLMKVLEIQRVQNFPEWERFKTNRVIISKKLGLNLRSVERLLWHGTSESAVVKIAKHSFNRSYSRKGKLGKGCYFARDSSYSAQDKFSVPNKTGEKFVILARVLVGQHTSGNKKLKDAPVTSSGDKFDSVVDNTKNPSMYVVFQDAVAYPEYIIKFVK